MPLLGLELFEDPLDPSAHSGARWVVSAFEQRQHTDRTVGRYGELLARQPEPFAARADLGGCGTLSLNRHAGNYADASAT